MSPTPSRPRTALTATVLSALAVTGLSTVPAVAAPPGEPVLNEFSASTAGTDVEYVELLGPAGWDPTGYRVLEIEGDAGTAAGTVDEVITIGAPDGDGRALVNLAPNALENGSVSLLVVKDFTGALGNDLDTNDDGTLDTTPWGSIVDSIAVNDGGAGDVTYGGVTLGVSYDGLSFAPGGASRIPDGTDTDAVGDWVRNDFDLAGIPGFTGTLVDGEAVNTPGVENRTTALPPGTYVDVAATADTATEGGADGAFELTRTGSTDAPLDVTVTVGGDASAADYTPAIPGTLTIPAGESSLAVPVAAVDDADAEGPETLTLTVEDGAGYSAGQSPTATVTIADDDLLPCATPDTAIGQVQGTTDASPLAGQTVTVQGTVVADYEFNGSLRGFYLQDAGDGDPATSDGVFVFQSSDNEVDLGDVVQVTGTVAEFQGQTQVNAGSAIEDCGATGTVAPTEATLPLSAPDDLERYEGMLVTYPQELTVTEHFQLGRFGQVVVSAGGRLPQPTSIALPGPDAQAVQAANNLRRLIVDDDLQTQNPDPIKLARDGQPLSASNTLRGGDTVEGLTGVMTYTWAGNSASGNAFRLRPVGALGGEADFEAANPRPAEAPEVGGTLRVSAFNVLNYFVTLDYPSGNPLDNACGPLNNVECRGADSALELERQKAKLLPALTELDADVLGIVEVENSTGADPFNDPDNGIVTGLNELAGPGTYAAVDTGVIGTDAIKVGLIYQPAAVTPVGGFEVIDGSDDARFRDDKNRPVLVQTFEENATGERFTAAVSHLKSKGSDCNDVGDPDLGDGQGNCNETRLLAAQAVADELDDLVAAGAIDEDILILGDLNSYAQEDPVRALEDAGFVNLIERFGGADAYSYVFDGQWGYLDHALASSTMDDQVTGAAEWHINADEPSVLDYNTDFKSAGQVSSLYAADQYRTSDHDPVVVGLDLDVAPRVTVVGDEGQCLSDTSVSLQVRITDPDTDVDDLDVTVAGSGAAVAPGSVELSGTGEVRTLTVGLRSGKRVLQGLVSVTVADAHGEDTLEIGVLSGTRGSDTLTATDGMPWVLVGGQGADTLTGADEGDLLCGGQGDDVLLGNGGDDTLVGDQGADTLTGGAVADAYDGGPGTDDLTDVDEAEGDVVRSA